MNSNNSVDNSKKGSDMSQLEDIAISGSEVDELQVPESELVSEYPGTEADVGKKNG